MKISKKTFQKIA